MGARKASRRIQPQPSAVQFNAGSRRAGSTACSTSCRAASHDHAACTADVEQRRTEIADEAAHGGVESVLLMAMKAACVYGLDR